jgi:glutathione synthase/RimK-type ligase-like ATP-grasp enzyme
MLENIKCLINACDEIGVPYKALDSNKNFIAIGFRKKHFFVNTTTPFNSQDVAAIANDKEFTYLLLKDAVQMPKTIGYVDPYVPEKFWEYRKEESLEEIADRTLEDFRLPVVIKRNSGSFGRNVFLCSDRKEIISAISKVFNHKSLYYDRVVLAQEKIESNREYRVVVIAGVVELVYATNFANVKFAKNSASFPTADILESQSENFQRIQEFIRPVFSLLDLRWGGLDVILDKNGKLWLIEINARPHFNLFIQKNGNRQIIDLYKKALEKFLIS